MTAHWRDISVPLGASLPTWPDSPGISTRLRLSIEKGDVANVTQLEMDVHTGTHVDAPRHFVEGAATIEELGLDPFIGPAIVIDTGDAGEIDSGVLRAAGVPAEADRVLLRTRNSSAKSMYSAPFDETYAALTLDGASWLAEQNVRLVGIDYLSIQRYDESPEVHRVLLNKGIAILEGISLRDVPAGPCDLICLPLNLPGAEAAPARAIVRHRQTESDR
jgi:arylformamidase